MSALHRVNVKAGDGIRLGLPDGRYALLTVSLDEKRLITDTYDFDGSYIARGSVDFSEDA